MMYNRQILMHLLGSIVAVILLPCHVSAARAADDAGRYDYGVAQT